MSYHRKLSARRLLVDFSQYKHGDFDTLIGRWLVADEQFALLSAQAAPFRFLRCLDSLGTAAWSTFANMAAVAGTLGQLPTLDGAGNILFISPASLPVGAHTHPTADIVSGTLSDARVAQSNVTQHQSAIDHNALLNFSIAQHRIINDAGTSLIELWSSNKISTELAGKAATVHTHAAGDITTGTFANARIAASNVTQHEAAITHQNLIGAGSNTHATIDSHLANLSNPHATTASQVGLGLVANILSNYVAAVDPTANDDSGDGYSVGSQWHNISDDAVFSCLDATVGAAVWKITSQRTYSATSDTSTTLTGTTAVTLLSGMTITPAAGTYLAFFSGQFGFNDQSSMYTIAVYVGGVSGAAIAGSTRTFDPSQNSQNSGNTMFTMATQATVTANGSQAVEIGWAITDTARTFSFFNRSLILVRV